MNEVDKSYYVVSKGEYARVGLDTNSPGYTGYYIGYTDVRYVKNNNFTAVRSYYYPRGKLDEYTR